MASTFSDQALAAYKTQMERIEPRFFEKNFDFKQKLRAIQKHSGRDEKKGERRLVGVSHELRDNKSLKLTVKVEDADEEAIEELMIDMEKGTPLNEFFERARLFEHSD